MHNILYLYFGATSPVTEFEKKLIKKISNTDNNLNVDFWDWTTEYKLKINPSLSWAQRNQEFLKPFNNKLLNISSKYDAVFIAQTGGIVPEIMEKIESLVVFNTADDPDHSEQCSFPFLNSADIIVHAGVNFDEKTKISEEFLRRGAKKCIFMPIGFYEEMFPPLINFDEQFEKRNIPLAFVGNPIARVNRLSKIVKNYNNELQVYYRKLHFYKKVYWMFLTKQWISSFESSLYELYQKTQIGINIHLSFGPSNVRTYQLNAAGIAQVLDCPEGNSELYEPEKEIMSYSNINEAIYMIDKLLNDKYLRYNISKSGYERVRACYNREMLLKNLFRDIFLGLV